LAGPLGRSIAQASDADAARQSSFDGSLHKVGRDERKRDRHVDLADAAFVAGSNLLDTGHSASNTFATTYRNSPQTVNCVVGPRGFEVRRETGKE
jgi:hypothetical protein